MSNSLTAIKNSPSKEGATFNSVTRREELKTFLREKGPCFYSDVLTSGIPKGTLAGLLKDKKNFTQNNEGKWMVNEEN